MLLASGNANSGMPEPGRLAEARMPATTGVPEPDKVDRRAAVRFPIEQDVRYKVFRRSSVEIGFGKTINISSSGILFTAERELARGERIEVAVNWPAQLDNKCPLKLVTTGRIVRNEGRRSAIAIDRYEFRTQGVHGMT